MRRRKRASRIVKFPRKRFERIVKRVLQASFRPLSRLSRSLSARFAETLFCTPPRQGYSRKDVALLASAQFRIVSSGTRSVATWRWGSGPVVLLVHGWGGHAGRLGAFIEPLTAAGFSVVSFDAPGHGISDGTYCPLPEFVLSVRDVANAYGGASALVGHSLGATACALAVREGMAVQRAVLISPPADPEHYSARFAVILRIPAPVRDAMKERLEKRYGFRWKDLSVVDCARGISAPLLLFHDRGDKKVPFREGEEITRAWPGSRLIATRHLGHHRILRDAEVVRQAVGFLRGEPPAAIQVENAAPVLAFPKAGKAVALSMG